MTDDDIPKVLFAMFLVALVAIVLGGLGGYQNGIDEGIKRMQKQATEHGYGEHDAKTGQWRWVEQERKEST